MAAPRAGPDLSLHATRRRRCKVDLYRCGVGRAARLFLLLVTANDGCRARLHRARVVDEWSLFWVGDGGTPAAPQSNFADRSPPACCLACVQPKNSNAAAAAPAAHRLTQSTELTQHHTSRERSRSAPTYIQARDTSMPGTTGSHPPRRPAARIPTRSTGSRAMRALERPLAACSTTCARPQPVLGLVTVGHLRQPFALGSGRGYRAGSGKRASQAGRSGEADHDGPQPDVSGLCSSGRTIAMPTPPGSRWCFASAAPAVTATKTPYCPPAAPCPATFRAPGNRSGLSGRTQGDHQQDRSGECDQHGPEGADVHRAEERVSGGVRHGGLVDRSGSAPGPFHNPYRFSGYPGNLNQP
ncbi:hypothetical protein GZL_09408 [Streptomyces sp. 769]|nr:hypothetical protein GZL_00005 [Streptomyces sp. 769]AJC61926.1 hypothetical protein GZL_09408 [Streptomyces sp. 769]